MRLRYFIVLLAAVGLVVAPAGALADTGFSATIDGLQEVPPNPSAGTGTGIFILNNAQTQLSFNISYGGLGSPETAAHIHNAPAGVNGGLVFPLPAANPKVGVWAIPAAMVAQLLAGNLYVNIHTSQFPGGEIRGQILSNPTPVKPSTWGRIKALYR
jgi:hypothetical protein